MYLPDLAPHPEAPGALAVGWLQRGEDYTRGEAPAGFAAALLAACAAKPVRVTRGHHVCDLCPTRGEAHGNAEIEVVGADGVHYAAPYLIGHYVDVHGYLPPAAFIAAFLRGDFVEDRHLRFHDFVRIDPEEMRAIQRGVCARLGIDEQLHARIDVRAAVVTIERSWPASPVETGRSLRVARETVGELWDGTLEAALAFVDDYARWSELVFDEHWAAWRPIPL